MTELSAGDIASLPKEIAFVLYDKCDICDDDQKRSPEIKQAWFVWDTAKLNFVSEKAKEQRFAILCYECNEDEEGWYEYEAVEAQMGWSKDWTPKDTPTKSTSHTPSTGWTDSAGVWHAYTTSKLPPKCDQAHFTKIEGPEGWGYLRLSSERGGMYIDTDADYALFFSFGWHKLDEPVARRVTMGTRENDIPIFAGQDTDTWPPMVMVDWTDYTAPPAHVIEYMRWTLEQWKAGKSIQFGCMGAHGRTGTFLAGLYILAGMAKTGEAAIKMVHDTHCVDAIEGSAQPDWVRKFAREVWGG